MSSSQVRIAFKDDRRVFQPGETLSAECVLEPQPADEVAGIDWSVYWRSEGKGDEDGDSIAGNGAAESDSNRSDSMSQTAFSVQLPRSPLSYDGVIIKIRWFVSASVRLSGGETLEGESEFQLGEVVPARELAEDRND